MRSRGDEVQARLDSLAAATERSSAQYAGLLRSAGAAAREPGAQAAQGPRSLSGLGPVGLLGLLGLLSEHADGDELERQAALLAGIDVSCHNVGPSPTSPTRPSSAELRLA